MKGTEYSPYKAVHHLDALKSGKPVLCRWLITHRCNHKCPVCINRHFPHYDPYEELPLEVALDIGRQMRELGIKAISISGGEPTLHGEFEPLVKELLAMGFDIGLITNGTLVHKLDPSVISRFSWFRVSVNAMSAETYAVVHGLPPSEAYWDRLAEFVAQVKGDCVVGSSFLLQPANVDEIEKFALWSKLVGFQTCRYSYVRNPDGRVFYPAALQATILQNMRKAKAVQEQGFQVFALSERLNLKMGSDKGYEHCYVSDIQLAVTANAGVYRCCSLQNSRIGFLGSLYELPLSRVWACRGVQDLKECPMCWQDKKNEFITYLMDPNPRHVNFL